MSIQKTLGGDRLGAGKKMKVELHNYERSTHDLGYIWRSTMAAGTLVPFMSEVALPGDTFDIELDANVLTHPSIGPLFGSFKCQLDVFQCPIRLYQGKLHNNKLGIGMNMAEIKLPLVEITAPNINEEDNLPIEIQQISNSALFAYLGYRGVGATKPEIETVSDQFNALPYLSYWDIYKNYYANKQEEIGAVIHASGVGDSYFTYAAVKTWDGTEHITATEPWLSGVILTEIEKIDISGYNITADMIRVKDSNQKIWELRELFGDIYEKIIFTIPGQGTFSQIIAQWTTGVTEANEIQTYIEQSNATNVVPKIETFPLENIDEMREDILEASRNNAPFIIKNTTRAPYGLPLENFTDPTTGNNKNIFARFGQEGLGLKTYQSDLHNNWLSTEWIDGEGGINSITAIDTSEGSFTIDTLNLSRKVYDMLNRIAVSGGSYDDWLEAVYTHDSFRKCESPMYMGGLSKEVIFQEVTSNAATEKEPLGSLAGRGRMSDKHKGGKIVIKVDEPSYIIGIVSLTPRIDYSQGNKWDMHLKTMDDFHKPALDQIGFQELITDQLAFWDRDPEDEENGLRSAGKQPAWINYMTNVNQCYGNFADHRSEMFMTLNRRYEHERDEEGNLRIKDLTTYIDPAKFNDNFAQAELDAQNFWVQLGIDITARRKMSAKVMPNL
jgi:hypothetical protein